MQKILITLTMHNFVIVAVVWCYYCCYCSCNVADFELVTGYRLTLQTFRKECGGPNERVFYVGRVRKQIMHQIKIYELNCNQGIISTLKTAVVFDIG